MPHDNIEVVRLIFEAFNSRDWTVWESHHHPDFEWSDPPELPGGGTHRGVDGVRRSMDEMLETADEWHVEVDDIESVGEDRVLMRGRSVLVGHASRIPMEDPLFQLFDLEQGRVSRVQPSGRAPKPSKPLGSENSSPPLLLSDEHGLVVP